MVTVLGHVITWVLTNSLQVASNFFYLEHRWGENHYFVTRIVTSQARAQTYDLQIAQLMQAIQVFAFS